MNIQKILILATPYSLIVSLLYLFGFWGAFNINILEYIAFSDVVKHALLPLIYYSVWMVIGIILGSFLVEPLEVAMPPGGGANRPEAKFVRFFIIFLLFLVLILVLYLILFESGIERWVKVSLLLVFPVIFFIGDASFLKEHIEHRQVRRVVFSSLVIVLISSFGFGVNKAKSIQNSEQEIKINNLDFKLNYIGWAGNYLFLWDYNKKTIVLMNMHDVKEIEIALAENKPFFSWSVFLK